VTNGPVAARAGGVRAAWDLLRCSHPEPVLAVTVASAILGIAAGRGWSTPLLAAAILSGQLFVGWTNDYIDREADRLAGRVDKPAAAGLVSGARLHAAAVVAGALCIPLSLANGLAAGTLHLVAVLVAFLYNAGLKKTPISVLPYLFSFGSLPAIVTLGLHPGHLPAAWLTLGAGLLGSGAHFTQVIPDIEQERKVGIHGLPQLIGVRGSLLSAAGLLAAAALVILFGPGHPGELQLAGLAITLVTVVAILVAGWRGEHRLAFRLTLVAAAGVALILLLNARALR
jgi:4-hydroxybenzoate polyprenyltransferase